MLNGYFSNVARCANIEKGCIHGMKSHDCHVFMEILLHAAFNSLPMHVLNPLIEISHFFKDLCSTSLKEQSLRMLEENIPIILRILERIFPPGLFESIKHISVHLSCEAWLGGPLQ